MGTIYYIGCKTCGIRRDLDKFYTMAYEVKSREDAIAFSERLEEDSYRAALLSSFMAEHLGHCCVMFTDNYDEMMDVMKKEKLKFWEKAK